MAAVRMKEAEVKLNEEMLASGETPLFAAAPQAATRGASAITEPAVTTSARGNRLC